MWGEEGMCGVSKRRTGGWHRGCGDTGRPLTPPHLVPPPQLGFFKRSVPYGTAMEKAQLKPQAASEA